MTSSLDIFLHHGLIDWLIHLHISALGVEKLATDLWSDHVVRLVLQELEQGLLLLRAVKQKGQF